MIQISFSPENLDFILKSLKKTTDEDGYLTEANNPSQRVITQDGEFIKAKDIGVVRPGSQIFIKKDIGSLVKLASDLI